MTVHVLANGRPPDDAVKQQSIVVGMSSCTCGGIPLPCLQSTSLTDFWGRRWNITTSSVLRTLIYDPIVEGGWWGVWDVGCGMWGVAGHVAPSSSGCLGTSFPYSQTSQLVMLVLFAPYLVNLTPLAGKLIRSDAEVSAGSAQARGSAHSPSSDALNKADTMSSGSSSQGHGRAAANGSDSSSSSQAHASAPEGPPASGAGNKEGSQGAAGEVVKKPQISTRTRTLGMCATFVASGIAHEGILWALQGRHYGVWTWKWLAFFSLQVNKRIFLGLP